MAEPVEVCNINQFWKCEHDRRNERDKWSSLLSVGIGLWLIPKYVEKYNASQKRMHDVAKRQQNIGLILKDHYLDVTHPQIVFALDKAMNMPLSELEVDCDVLNSKAGQLADNARSFGQQLSKRYHVCDEFGCDNELDAYAAMAGIDAAYSRRQFNQRRYERRMQLKRQVVQKAHAGTMQSPGPFMQLLDNAAQVYATLFQNAQTNLAGATATFGYGLGGLGGTSRGL